MNVVSKLLSVFPWTINGNTDNNLVSPSNSIKADLSNSTRKDGSLGSQKENIM
jgi:hypothetical protein